MSLVTTLMNLVFPGMLFGLKEVLFKKKKLSMSIVLSLIICDNVNVITLLADGTNLTTQQLIVLLNQFN